MKEEKVGEMGLHWSTHGSLHLVLIMEVITLKGSDLTSGLQVDLICPQGQLAT